MRRIFLSVGIIVAVLASVLFLISIAEAKKTLNDASGALDTAVEPTGIEKTEVTFQAGRVVKGVLASVGFIFFILMVWSGLRWMTARGDEAKADKARDTIIGATIGLMVIVGSYAVTTFVTNRIIKGQSSESAFGEAIKSTSAEPKICCIVPTTAGSSVYTASMRAESECGEISEGGKLGVDWGMYETKNIGQCVTIFNCWDNPDGGSQSSGFDSCLDKITNFAIVEIK